MYRRPMTLFKIIVVGVALTLVTSAVAAQSFDDPDDFDDFVGTDIYGTPMIAMSDSAGDGFICQDQSQTAGINPLDVTNVSVFRAPRSIATSGGFRMQVEFSENFQQVASQSARSAVLVRAVNSVGYSDYRLYDVSNGVVTRGAADGNFNPISGTEQLADVSPDGDSVWFAFQPNVTQWFLRSFYVGSAGDTSICDSVPDGGAPITMPPPWETPDELPPVLTTIADESGDTVVCGEGGSVDAPQADITSVRVTAAQPDMPFPDGYAVSIETSQLPSEAIGSAANYTVYLNLLRGNGAEQNWLLSSVNGQISNRVLNADNTPTTSTSRWGDYTGTSMADPLSSYGMTLNIPGDVTHIQARTALTAEQGGQQVCDQTPSDGRQELPPAWLFPSDENRVASLPETTDRIVLPTATPTPILAGPTEEHALPETDIISSVNVFQGALPGGGTLTYLGVPIAPPDPVEERLMRVNTLNSSGETHTITLQQSAEQVIAELLSGGDVLYTFTRPAYYDPSRNTAFFALPGAATQVTVEVSTTTEDGRTVSDSTGPINLPAQSPESSLNISEWRGRFCPPLDNLAPDDPLWEHIWTAWSNRPVLPVTEVRDEYVSLWDPQEPFDPVSNPVWISPYPCPEPADAVPQTALPYVLGSSGSGESPGSPQEGFVQIPEQIVLCPPLDSLAPDDSLWDQIYDAVEHWKRVEGTDEEILQEYLTLRDPNQPFNPVSNPLVWEGNCPAPEEYASARPGVTVWSRKEFSDPADDSVQCQNPGATIADNPADITGIQAYLVPNDFATPGYLFRIELRTPLEQLLDTSFSAAVSVRAVRANGQRENRLIEVHDGARRIGAADDNNNVIAGTANLVGFSDDGYLLVNFPPDTARVEVRSFHTASQTDAVACDSVEVLFEELVQSETLGDLFDRLGVTLCPPLANLFDLDMPLDPDSAALVILGLVFTSGAGSNGTHLELANPDFPHHPLFNPLIWKQNCEGVGDL